MDDYKEQQKEALLEVEDYIQKLEKAVPQIAVELRSEGLPDTDAYMKAILDGINYTIEVLKRTLDYINAEEKILTKEEVNEWMNAFMKAYKTGDKLEIANAFEKELGTYLKRYHAAIQKTCA